jgi:predicted small integral membrane protein
MPLRQYLTAVVVACVASYFSLIAFNNVTDFETNHGLVKAVLNMEGVKTQNLLWRAIESPALVKAAYLIIIATEVVIAILAWFSVILKLLGRGAKPFGMVALALAFTLFMFGFVVIGGEWFYMWQNPVVSGLVSKATILALLMLAALMFVIGEEEASPGGSISHE